MSFSAQTCRSLAVAGTCPIIYTSTTNSSMNGENNSRGDIAVYAGGLISVVPEQTPKKIHEVAGI